MSYPIGNRARKRLKAIWSERNEVFYAFMVKNAFFGVSLSKIGRKWPILVKKGSKSANLTLTLLSQKCIYGPNFCVKQVEQLNIFRLKPILGP